MVNSGSGVGGGFLRVDGSANISIRPPSGTPRFGDRRIASLGEWAGTWSDDVMSIAGERFGVVSGRESVLLRVQSRTSEAASVPMSILELRSERVVAMERASPGIETRRVERS